MPAASRQDGMAREPTACDPNSALLTDAFSSATLRMRRGKTRTLIWLNAVKGRATARALHISAHCVSTKGPMGNAAGPEVTTVDQADMRALVSRKTVVRHGAASL